MPAVAAVMVGPEGVAAGAASVGAGAAGAGAPAGGLLGTLLLAFVGGLILNLMPCVFPVLGIKILGFVNQAGADRRKVTLHGFVFTAGVLLSFWVLAALLAVLRAGGSQLGWGFQPGFPPGRWPGPESVRGGRGANEPSPSSRRNEGLAGPRA